MARLGLMELGILTWRFRAYYSGREPSCLVLLRFTAPGLRPNAGMPADISRGLHTRLFVSNECLRWR